MLFSSHDPNVDFDEGLNSVLTEFARLSELVNKVGYFAYVHYPTFFLSHCELVKLNIVYCETEKLLVLLLINISV